jgi:hypothetical protein
MLITVAIKSGSTNRQMLIDRCYHRAMGNGLIVGGVVVVIGAGAAFLFNRYDKKLDKDATPVRCTVDGHLFDRSKRPLAGAYVFAGDETSPAVMNATVGPDGHFKWEGQCERIDDAPIRVTRGQGYCFVETNDSVSSESIVEHNLYVDREALEASGPDECP